MGSEETVWLLGIDGSEALGTLEEIITALGDAKEAIAGFVAAAADLSSLDAAFANISSAITDTSTSATDLDEAMAQMSATVAEDTAIIDSLNETVANLEAQLAALTTEADSAAESAGNLGLSFQDIQKGISSVGDNVSGFMGGIGEMLGGVGDFADSVFMGALKLQMFAQMAAQVGGALIAPAATAEQTQVAFVTLMHSTKAASDEMQKLNAFAAETPFQTHDIDVAAEKMLAFGFKAKDVIPDITAIGDALSALGEATPAQLSGVVDVFGKIQAAGKLSAANMHELAVRGIPAWQMLSEEMGKPVDVLQKMVSKGAIPASTAIDDLRKGMEKTFGGGMATQAQTFNGLMSTLKSNADQALAAFVGPVMKEAEGGISGIANTLASPAFQTFATGVGAMIAHTFSDIGRFAQTNVVPAVDDVVKAFASPSFKSFADTVGKGISLILHDIGDIGKNIVEPAIKGVAGVFASPQFADFTGKMGDLGNSINNVVMPAVISLKPDITDLFNVFKTVALPALSGVADGLSKTIGWFQKGGAPADALKIAIAGVAAGLTAMKIGQFVAALPGLIAQLGIWAGAQWAVAIPALMTALPYIAIGILVTAVVAGIILAVQHWGQIAHWLQGVWAGIAGFFEWLWGKISGFFVGIGKWFADKFTEAYNGVIGVFLAAIDLPTWPSQS